LTDYNHNILDLSGEFEFKSSRSSGPGGQNVNKVNSRIELIFDVVHSLLLSDRQKKIILMKLKTRIHGEGILSVVSQNERSALMNKRECVNKFYAMIHKALRPVKKRIPTRPTKSSRRVRLKNKKINSQQKILRGRIKSEE